MYSDETSEGRTAGAEKTLKIFEKTFEKPLDKGKRKCYTKQAVRQKGNFWSGQDRSLIIEQQEIRSTKRTCKKARLCAKYLVKL